jgi:hypothetical protein
MPLLQSDERIARVAVSRGVLSTRPSTVGARSNTAAATSATDALREALDGADVVVHLAFMITGSASPDDLRDQRRRGPERVPGAAATGAKRFV